MQNSLAAAPTLPGPLPSLLHRPFRHAPRRLWGVPGLRLRAWRQATEKGADRGERARLTWFGVAEEADALDLGGEEAAAVLAAASWYEPTGEDAAADEVQGRLFLILWAAEEVEDL